MDGFAATLLGLAAGLLVMAYLYRRALLRALEARAPIPDAFRKAFSDGE